MYDLAWMEPSPPSDEVVAVANDVPYANRVYQFAEVSHVLTTVRVTARQESRCSTQKSRFSSLFRGKFCADSRATWGVDRIRALRCSGGFSGAAELILRAAGG